MKLQVLFALTLGLLGSFAATAQENNRSNTDVKSEKKVVIIKKYRDANGEERTEKIVKQGDEIGDLDKMDIQGLDKLKKQPHCAPQCAPRELPKGGFLGVILGDNTSSGVVITAVEPETAAQKADIRMGDIITSVNGKRVRTTDELRTEMGGLKPNDKVKIGILRDLDKLTKTAVLGAYTEQTHKSGRCEGKGKHPHRKIEKNEILIDDTQEPTDRIGKSGAEVQDFQVFPNPNNGNFTLKVDLGKSGLKTVITVSDVSGKELVREEMVGETGLFEKQYDLSKQAKGTYLIKIQQADKVLIEKIIFQN